MATIILPPGSSSADLQAAINSAGPGVNTIITISSDMMFTGVVTIPADRIIILAANGNWILNGGNISNLNAFTVNGTLNLGEANPSQGGVLIITGFTNSAIRVTNGGIFNMYGGEIRDNTAIYSSGGGVFVSTGSIFNMYGGEIGNNIATTSGGGSGGGVHVNISSIFNMYNGEIRGNIATVAGGGGVFVSDSIFNMYGGEIYQNETLLNTAGFGGGYGGGGVFVAGSGTNIFTMSGGSIHNNDAHNNSGGGVFVSANTSFTMSGNATIYENAANVGGGVTVWRNAIFDMYSGSIHNNILNPGGPQGARGAGVFIQPLAAGIDIPMFNMYGGSITGNNAGSSFGGGVSTISSGIFNMYNGEISNNRAYIGGGVDVRGSLFFMLNGEISGNIASLNGGGVYVRPDLGVGGSFLMNGGEVSDNIAVNGGGVFVMGISSIFSMIDGTIRDNEANYGGGIYNSAISEVNISGMAEIANNRAADNGNGQGGGIFTNNFNQLTVTGPGVRFASNRADFATDRNPVNDVVYGTHILNMEGNWTVPFTQGYNNFDINQIGPRLLLLIYDANGGVNPPNPMLGPIVTVAGQGSMSFSGHVFIGWNTAPDGSGTEYLPGDTITLTSDMVLYAQWVPVSEDNCDKLLVIILLMFMFLRCSTKKPCCKHCCECCKKN